MTHGAFGQSVRLSLALLVGLLGGGGAVAAPAQEAIAFPKGFWWGAAMAAHQVEGNLDNDWSAFETIAQASSKAYHALHASDRDDADGDGRAAQVGIAQHIAIFDPHTGWNPVDMLTAHFNDQVFNRAFLRAVTRGELKFGIPGRLHGLPAALGLAGLRHAGRGPDVRAVRGQGASDRGGVAPGGVRRSPRLPLPVGRLVSRRRPCQCRLRPLVSHPGGGASAGGEPPGGA